MSDENQDSTPPVSTCEISEAGQDEITENRAPRHASTQSELPHESLLRSLYESVPLVMGIVDLTASNQILHVYDSPAAARFFCAEAGIPASWESGAPPEAIRQWITHYRLCEKLGKPVHFEYVHSTPHGPLWLAATVALIGPAPSGGVRFSYVAEDITKRRQVEEALRRSEEQYRRIIETAGEGVWVIDTETRTKFVNRRMAEMFGYPPEEMLGRAPCDFAFEEDAASYPQQLAAYMQSGSALFDVRFRRKDGMELWVSINFAPIVGDQGQPLGFLGMVTDITQRRQTEQALAKSEAALKQANEELRTANDELRISNETLELRVAERTADLEYRTGQLRALAEQLTRAEENERMRVAEILHDGLQQMLVSARLNLEALGEQFQDQSVRQGLRQVSEILDESVQVSHSLVYELCPPILHRRDLAAILRWLGQWFQAKHRLTVQMDEGPEVEVPAEEIRATLFRSVSELLFNIVKHTQVKSVRLSLSQTEGGSVQIAVSYEGGFDPEAIHKESDGHTGFGLFHLRRRLELFGGRLEEETTPGPGKRFTLLLPISPSRID